MPKAGSRRGPERRKELWRCSGWGFSVLRAATQPMSHSPYSRYSLAIRVETQPAPSLAWRRRGRGNGATTPKRRRSEQGAVYGVVMDPAIEVKM